jgi:hypothetical protein
VNERREAAHGRRDMWRASSKRSVGTLQCGSFHARCADLAGGITVVDKQETDMIQAETAVATPLSDVALVLFVCTMLNYKAISANSLYFETTILKPRLH